MQTFQEEVGDSCSDNSVTNRDDADVSRRGWRVETSGIGCRALVFSGSGVLFVRAARGRAFSSSLLGVRFLRRPIGAFSLRRFPACVFYINTRRAFSSQPPVVFSNATTRRAFSTPLLGARCITFRCDLSDVFKYSLSLSS